ncbi:MAG: ThuA domain-containing protein [Steroidobacteraceae bacterium]
MTSTAFIFTGGIGHPFDSAAPALAGLLEAAGLKTRQTLEMEEFTAWLEAEPDALAVVYALRWGMTQHEKYAPYRAQWAYTLPDPSRAVLAGHVRRGGGLLGLHTASICFDDWPGWGEVLGGAWEWGRSYHPALGPVQVRPRHESPLVADLPDFALTDEVYTGLALQPGITVLCEAEASLTVNVMGETVPPTGWQPVVWAHRYGSGRAAYDGLGHDAASLEHPAHRQLIQRLAHWTLGQPATPRGAPLDA